MEHMTKINLIVKSYPTARQTNYENKFILFQPWLASLHECPKIKNGANGIIGSPRKQIHEKTKDKSRDTVPLIFMKIILKPILESCGINKRRSYSNYSI
jgi:hypothetical protein